MDDRLLGRFRLFLVAWTGAVIAHFTYVQARTDWGARDVPWDWTNPWHPTYFGVVNATFFVVPFLMFHLPVAARYGGWSSAIGRAIIALGIGTTLWGFGNCYWFIQNVRGVEAPYPSLADAGYLAVLPFAGWALFELARVVGLDRRDWRWLPAALAVAFPLNAYIMLPQGIGAGTFDTPLAAVISSTYVISDVVLLGISILVAIGARRAAGARFFAPVLAVTAAIAMLYVGDLVFNYRIANDLFYNAEVSDMIYGVFIILSSVAVWLFLRADVRAAAEAAAAHDSWSPLDEQDAAGDGLDLTPLDELATAIVRGQERVMGVHTARSIARNVVGVELREDLGLAAVIDEVAVDALVREYRSVAGPLGEMACWTSARPVFARHPELRIRSLERFRQDSEVTGGPTAPQRVPVGAR
ncbi:MAG: sensor-containing diguanylate cyclase/phosphodiesterase [Thermoleophilia bacterium]|nr:sensor-containing diguanylate cyclase/phosphodiesterase [Thermoleophilia bacterium]